MSSLTNKVQTTLTGYIAVEKPLKTPRIPTISLTKRGKQSLVKSQNQKDIPLM